MPQFGWLSIKEGQLFSSLRENQQLVRSFEDIGFTTKQIQHQNHIIPWGVTKPTSGPKNKLYTRKQA